MELALGKGLIWYGLYFDIWSIYLSLSICLYELSLTEYFTLDKVQINLGWLDIWHEKNSSGSKLTVLEICVMELI